MNKLTFLFIPLVALVISCSSKDNSSSSGGEAQAVITIHPGAILRTIDQIPIGININFYLDSDEATKATTTLAQSIKNLGVKYLRYPGGDKSDEYLFAYPPYEKAEPHATRKGKNSSLGRGLFMDESGSNYKYPAMDFDAFMQLCRETDCEPIIVVAADTRSHPLPAGVTGVSTLEQMLENAVEWVRYSNIKKNYGVKYWMIGNETWHDNVKQYYTQDDYISDIRIFSDAMKAVDPTIKIIPNTNGQFTKRLLEEAADKFDMLCISNYPLFDWKGYDDWASGKQNVMNPYNNVVSEVQKYAPTGKKDMPIIVAEYGAFDWGKNGWGAANDMGHAMCNFDITGNQLLEHQIPFSCYWNTRWEYKSDQSGFNALDDNNNILPVGWTLRFWTKHLFPNMIKAESSSTKLTVFSSFDPAANQAYIYVMNKDKAPLDVNLSVKGKKISEIAQVARMTGQSPEDFAPIVDTVSYKEKNDPQLPPYSITIYQLNFK